MFRSGLTFTCAVGAALTIACGGGNNQSADHSNNGAAQLPGAAARSDAPTALEVRGCLTASGDRFVLTALRTSEGSTTGNNNAGAGSNGGAAAGSSIPTTESYQLSGGDENQLRQHVGREVRVTGEADAARVAEVQETTPSAPAVGTSGQQSSAAAGKPTPQVKSVTETRLQIRKLTVASITATGNDCASGTNLPAAAQ